MGCFCKRGLKRYIPQNQNFESSMQIAHLFFPIFFKSESYDGPCDYGLSSFAAMNLLAI